MLSIDFWGWAALGLLAVLAAVLVARAIVWRRREAQWKDLPPIALNHPVVMVHGILGFDKIGFLGVHQEYFRGIWRYLELLGVDVAYPRLPMVGSVTDRAQALAHAIKNQDRGPVIVVAHSMGGLDARYAIHSLGLEEQVVALVTIGTPHRGTSIADLSGHTVSRIFRWLLSRWGLDTPAIDGMTRASTHEFNENVIDSQRVQYFSVISAASWRTILFNPALWVGYLYLRWREGPNDGLVPTSSQRWGRVLDEIDADHWSQIGWTLRFDARRLYEGVLRQLVERGF